MTEPVWQLYRTNDRDEWISLGSYESLAAATKRIIEGEAIPVRGLTYQLYVNADTTRDADLLGTIAFTGKYAHYRIDRAWTQIHTCPNPQEGN